MIPFRFNANYFLLAGCAFALAAGLQAQVVQIDPVLVEGRRELVRPLGYSHVDLTQTSATALPSIQNLAGRVPNLGAADGRASSYGDLVSLRGVSNTPFFTDPAVSVYMDDLPLASTFAFPVGWFGYESAEVYRGPQGSRFGRAGEGGVIVLRSPDWDRPRATELEVGAGDHQLLRATLSARGQNSAQTMSAYADVARFEREGYIDNLTTHQQVDEVDQIFARAGLRWVANDTATFMLRLLGGRTRNGAQPLVPIGGPLDTVTRPADGMIHVDSVGAALTGEFALPTGTLRSVTAVSDWQLSPYTNVLEIGVALDSEILQNQRQWSQELVWQSPESAATQWRTGLFWSNIATDGSISRGLVGLFLIEASDFTIDADTTALFGEVTHDLGDRLSLLTGLRLERTQKDFTRTEIVPGTAHIADAQTYEALYPRVQLDYELLERARFTTAVALSGKPGGWSSFTGNKQLARFAPERLTSFEAGLHANTADQKLRGSLTVFGYAIRDYQIERSFSATDYLVVNAPRARSLGGELELDWRPSRQWRFTAAAGWTDMTLRKFTDPYDQTDYAGKRAPYTPDYTLAVGGDWHADSGWYARADVVTTGSIYYDESERAASGTPARIVVDLAVGFERPAWRVSAAATNVFDREYYSLLIPGVGHGVPGASRQLVFTGAWRW